MTLFTISSAVNGDKNGICAERSEIAATLIAYKNSDAHSLGYLVTSIDVNIVIRLVKASIPTATDNLRKAYTSFVVNFLPFIP